LSETFVFFIRLKQLSDTGKVKMPEPQNLLSWAVAGWKTLGDHISRQLWLLEKNGICTEATRRTRLKDFGDPPIDPALTVLLNSLELEADLHPLGRFLMRVHLRDLLATRLRLTQAWTRQSEGPDLSAIERPIFITGMPRAGSTFLHELLTEDPENRAPRVWEVMFPLPIGNSSSSKADPRVRKTEAQLWWFRRLAPGADSVYPIRAWSPHECVAIHSYTLLSQEFVSICPIPTYEGFLKAADLGPAYRWQKRFLQHLQLRCSKRRWVLKSPDHVYGLDKLLTVFPDAAIIQTHRNPLDVLKSQIQLTQVLEGMFCRPEDREQLRMREVRKIRQMVEYISRFRDVHPELAARFIDVKYRELVVDPLSVVRRIYEHLDIPLTRAAAGRMQRLVLSRSRYQRRKPNPTLAVLERSGPDETLAFEGYCARFGIPYQESE
jgi:hypothetical protein